MARENITYERLIRRDRKYKFLRFLFTLVLLFIGVRFMLHVEARLSEYEFNQPVNVIKRFLVTVEENASGASKSSLTLPSVPKDTLDSLTAFSKEQSLTYKEVKQAKSDEHHYNLLCGSEIIASIQLKERMPGPGETYSRWDIASIELIISCERLAVDLLNDLQSGDYSYILENTDLSSYPTETVSDLSKFISNAVSGRNFTLSESKSSSADEKEYIYLLDGEPFFTAYITKDSAKGSIWQFSGGKAHFINPVLYTAKIPAGLTLYVNNNRAPDEWISNTSESEHASRVADNVVNPVDLSFKHYEIPFAFSVPEFSLKDSLGNDHPFTLQDTELLPCSTESVLLPEFSHLEEDIREAVENIANFFVGRVELGRIQKYVEKNSKAYDVFFEYIKWRSMKAGVTSMETYEIKNMTKLGDNCFVVEISGLFKAHYTQTNIIDYPLSYTLYYHTVDGSWFIYDFISN